MFVYALFSSFDNNILSDEYKLQAVKVELCIYTYYIAERKVYINVDARFHILSHPLKNSIKHTRHGALVKS